jgi:carbonic anhydrase
MSNLFLICPECHIEQAIRDYYGNNNVFFLTALGTVFDISAFEDAEEINDFLSREGVGSIYVVDDSSCTFIQNVLRGVTHSTEAEDVLYELYDEHKSFFEMDNPAKDKAHKLAELNIHRQAQALDNTAFLGSKMKNKDVHIKGLIFDREEQDFEEVTINI